MRALFVSAADGSHAVRVVDDPRLVGPVDFAWRRAPKATVLGAGPVAGTFVPGANRLVVCGTSPQWGAFHVSTLGGAGLPWRGLGVDVVAIAGRAPAPSVLVLRNFGGRLSTALVPLDPDPIWRGRDGEIGIYALLGAVFDRFAAEFPIGRVLAVGPAAARTRAGAIGSAPVEGKRLTPIDTWAGRGGMGSRLFAEHHLVAVVYGGDAPADEGDRAGFLERFERTYGRSLEEVTLEKTRKYRFDPAFRTGGTFGSNYRTLRERALSFHYRSVLFSDETRDRIHARLIEGHYLRQFEEEMASSGRSFTCGEPCAAACKKVDGRYKKDYEPYQALGPLVGVFDQRAAESLVRFADAMGFDTIELGGTVAFAMEALERGWLGPSETGIAERPRWEPDGFDPVADSAHNAALAERLVAWILDDVRAAPFRRGLRVAARALGGEAAQAAVYVARGDGEGAVVPNQYWVPGVLAPVPVLGRYYLDYTYEWQPPHALGAGCAERMRKELMLDNYGMCRFHRGWAETVLPEVVNRFRGLAVDAEEHHRHLALEIDEAGVPAPWETERVVDLVQSYLHKYRADGPPEPGLDEWIDRFRRDRRAAARAYWQEIRDGFVAALRRPQEDYRVASS